MFLSRAAVRTVLALLCAVVILVTLFLPWWKITIRGLGGPGDSIVVYPYTLRGERLKELVMDSGQYSGSMSRSREMTLHTIALASSAALCVVGAIIRGQMRGIPLAAAGLVVLVDAQAFVQRIARICEINYNVPPQGKTTVIMPIGAYDITTEFLSGLSVARAGAALALLVAALFLLVREKRAAAADTASAVAPPEAGPQV